MHPPETHSHLAKKPDIQRADAFTNGQDLRSVEYRKTMNSPRGSPDGSSYGETLSQNHDDEHDGGSRTMTDDDDDDDDDDDVSIRSDHAQDYHEEYPDAPSPRSDIENCQSSTVSSVSSEDDEEYDFPPGYVTDLHELNSIPLTTRRASSSSAASLHPAILLPTYFFCPLGRCIMKDPVVTPDGYTFERRAILRCLVLSSTNPFTGKPLCHEELREDRLVKTKIDKARREAWMRYVVEVRGADVHRIVKQENERGRVVVASDDSSVEILSEDEGILDTTTSTAELEGCSTKDEEEDEENSLVIDASSSSSSVEEDNEKKKPQNVSPTYNMRPKQNQNLIRSNFEGVLPVYNNPKNHRRSDASQSSSTVPTEPNNIHGWNTPLGVHRIICKPPGIIVTTTVHRRSAAVQRKIIQKKLVNNVKRGRKRETSTKQNLAQEIPMGILQMQSSSATARNNRMFTSSKYKTTKQKYNNKQLQQQFQTSLSVTSRELVLPPGSYVEITETVVHGGRVRGNICWEEEMAVELDEELLSHVRRWEDEARRGSTDRNSGSDDVASEHGAAVAVGGGNRKKKSKRFFRRRNSHQESHAGKNPFSLDLFTESPHHDMMRRSSPSPPPITTVKYTGWISLQWAGMSNNREREEAARRLRSGDSLGPDEDDGPWSQPLPLGVYRIQGDGSSGLGQLPLSDAADSDRNITHVLVDSQCVEVVETRVVVMKRKIKSKDRLTSNQHRFGMYAADGVQGVRTVRARCMVPVLIPPMVPQDVDGVRCVNALAQKKFKSGWISLCTDNDSNLQHMTSTALPLSLGAYIVVSGSGCAVTEGDRCDSKIRAILPCRSCIEVVTTRIEFEERESLMTCHCGRESMHSVVAIRALLASGGHATLFVFPISASGTFDNLCLCGNLVQRTIAEPVPRGTYKISNRGGVSVSARLSKDSPVIFTLEEDAFVEITQTGVEEGCVRGRVRLEMDATNEDDVVTGWINLFEFPDRRWVEYVFEE
ncbi:hypothetical protein ACHAW6_003356 [Cyclotella cf. meneghiniana]